MMSHKCDFASPFIFMYLFSKLLTVSLEIHLKKYVLVIATSDFQMLLFHTYPRIESQCPKINETQHTLPWFSVFEMEDFSLRSRGAAAILRRQDDLESGQNECRPAM